MNKTHRPVSAVIKGSGFNSSGGGFTRIHIDGVAHHPDDVAHAVNSLPALVKALEAAEPVIDMSLSYYGSDAAVSALRSVRAALASHKTGG